MMLDFEPSIKFHKHSIVEVGSIVSDVPFGDTVMEDEVMLDKPDYNVLGD